MVVSTHGTIIELVLLFLKSWIELNKGMRGYVYLARAIKIVRQISDHNPIIIDSATTKASRIQI